MLAALPGALPAANRHTFASPVLSAVPAGNSFYSSSRSMGLGLGDAVVRRVWA